MPQIFSQSVEYDKLKADWALKKQYLIDELKDIKLADSDKQLAGKLRGIVAELRSLDAMEEAIDKYFNKEQ